MCHGRNQESKKVTSTRILAYFHKALPQCRPMLISNMIRHRRGEESKLRMAADGAKRLRLSLAGSRSGCKIMT